ncbi:hypothetical protein JHW40_22350 (plasmid) [Paracoccus alcaliphilus]|nr:hypothetical protein JHW40_22350 [Paracoccus alcaliphilus]
MINQEDCNFLQINPLNPSVQIFILRVIYGRISIPDRYLLENTNAQPMPTATGGKALKIPKSTGREAARPGIVPIRVDRPFRGQLSA